MDRVILQVPMSRELKEKGEKEAHAQGFSSLQETIRVIVQKFVSRDLKIFISEGDIIQLSSKAEKRYLKMDEDFKQGKNVYQAKDVADLLKQLK